jgi:tRNA U34 5-carboxymethylaminomethyl modifying enzyme MnmG/GidA
MRNAQEILTHNGMSLERLFVMFRAGTGEDDAAHLRRLERIDPSVHASLQTVSQYAPELQRQNDEIARIRRQSDYPLPAGFDFLSIPQLSGEEREKLQAAQPSTIGALWKIPGITPSTIMVLYGHLRRSEQQRRNEAKAPVLEQLRMERQARKNQREAQEAQEAASVAAAANA